MFTPVFQVKIIQEEAECPDLDVSIIQLQHGLHIDLYTCVIGPSYGILTLSLL